MQIQAAQKKLETARNAFAAATAKRQAVREDDEATDADVRDAANAIEAASDRVTRAERDLARAEAEAATESRAQNEQRLTDLETSQAWTARRARYDAEIEAMCEIAEKLGPHIARIESLFAEDTRAAAEAAEIAGHLGRPTTVRALPAQHVRALALEIASASALPDLGILTRVADPTARAMTILAAFGAAHSSTLSPAEHAARLLETGDVLAVTGPEAARLEAQRQRNIEREQARVRAEDMKRRDADEHARKRDVEYLAGIASLT